MNIRFRNTVRDIWAFSLFHYPRSPVFIAIYGLGFVVLSIFIFLALPEDLTLISRIAAFIALECLAFVMLGAMFLLSIALSLLFRRNETVLGEHSITLNDDGFTVQSHEQKTQRNWSAIKRIARTRGHIFLYLAGFTAHVVPRDAFKDEEEWTGFYSFCEAKVHELAPSNEEEQ